MKYPPYPSGDRYTYPFASTYIPLSVWDFRANKRKVKHHDELLIAVAHPTLSRPYRFRRCIDPKRISETFVYTITQ